MKQNEVVIFVGIQSCGKSTFYRRRFFQTHLRVNLDQLRTRNREKRFLQLCLETGVSFVVDNTNPTKRDRCRYVGPAKEAGFRVICFYFESKINPCLARNELRPESHKIPEAGVRGTHAKLEIPEWSEGFDEVTYVRIAGSGKFNLETWRAKK